MKIKQIVKYIGILGGMALVFIAGWIWGIRMVQAQDFNWLRINDATRAHYFLGIAASLREGNLAKVIRDLESDTIMALWASSQDHRKKAPLSISEWDNETVLCWQEAKKYFAQYPETINRDRPTNFRVVRDLLSQVPALEREGLEKDFMRTYAGKTPPALHIQEWIGPEATLTDLRGKVLLLDFWHIDCPGCLTRMPHLQQLQHQYGKRGLKVLAIHSARMGDFGKVPRFLRAHRYDLSVGLDKQAKTEVNYAVQAWPTYYLVDRRGHLAWGPNHDLPTEEILLPLLSGQ
jgi:thiol-disulfide isomerase/thioredoxin